MPPKRLQQGDAEATNKKDGNGRKRTARSNAAAAGASKYNLVTKLGPYDVLMGRGALATDYEGNLRLREMVRLRQDEYIRAAKRNRKHQIAEEVVQQVKAKGGRFLQGAETVPGLDPRILPRDEAAWLIVEDMNVITAKVKQNLRDVKPKSESALLDLEESKPPSEVTVTNTFGGPGAQLQAGAASAASPPMHPNLSPALASLLGSQAVPGHPPSHSWVNPQGNQPLQAVRAGQPSAPPPQGQAQVPPQGQHAQAHGSQRHAAVSLSTSNLGQENASAVLRALMVDQASRGQQPNALMALMVQTGRLHHDVNHNDQQQAGPTTTTSSSSAVAASSSEHARIGQILAMILEQSQQRSRERSMIYDLLSQIIRPGRNQDERQAPPPELSETTIRSLIELFRAEGNPSQNTSTSSVSHPPPPPPPQAPANSLHGLPPELAALIGRGGGGVSSSLASSLPPELASLLGGGTAPPREVSRPISSVSNSSYGSSSTSLLAELERLLPPQHRRSQHQPRQQQEEAGDPVRGLQDRLRSLQERPQHPPS